MPCYQAPEGLIVYAKPIENLFAVYDIGKREVIRAIDGEPIPVSAALWALREEVAARAPLRPEASPARLAQPTRADCKLIGGNLEWNIGWLIVQVPNLCARARRLT